MNKEKIINLDEINETNDNGDEELKIEDKKDKKTSLLSFIVVCILGLGGYSAYVTNNLEKTNSSLKELSNKQDDLNNSYKKIDFSKYITKTDSENKQKELDKNITNNITDIKTLEKKQENDIKELKEYIDSSLSNLAKLIKESNETKTEAIKVKVEDKKEKQSVNKIKEKDLNIDNGEEDIDTYICFYNDKDYCKSFAIENKSEFYKMGNQIYKTKEDDLYICDMNVQDKPSCNYYAYINKKTKFKIGFETYRVIDHNTYRLIKNKKSSLKDNEDIEYSYCYMGKDSCKNNNNENFRIDNKIYNSKAKLIKILDIE